MANAGGEKRFNIEEGIDKIKKVRYINYTKYVRLKRKEDGYKKTGMLWHDSGNLEASWVRCKKTIVLRKENNYA